jgi:hypothetical protein
LTKRKLFWEKKVFYFFSSSSRHMLTRLEAYRDRQKEQKSSSEHQFHLSLWLIVGLNDKAQNIAQAKHSLRLCGSDSRLDHVREVLEGCRGPIQNRKLVELFLEKKDDFSVYLAAMLLDHETNDSRRLELLSEAANSCDYAKAELGRAFLLGRGVEVDLPKGELDIKRFFIGT